MAAKGATAGGSLTKEQRDYLLAQQLINTGTDPVVKAAMEADPKTAIAKSLAKSAADSTPAAGGGWAWASGLGRIGSGLLAHKENKELEAKAGALEDQTSKGTARALAIAQGLPPPADVDPTQPALTQAPPPQAMDEVAAAAQAQQNPAAAAAPAPPPPAPPPAVAPPGTAPGVQGPPPVDPQQAAAVAQAMTGPPPGAPPPGAPPPNPIPAQPPQGLGAAPSVPPAPPSAQSTPLPGSLGGGAADDTLQGGATAIPRTIRRAAGVSRVGLPAGDAIEQIALSAVPGLNVTSRQRSAAHNKDVGGVGNSFHLPDEKGVEHARDFTPPQGISMAALGRRLKAKFGSAFDVINEGNHIHVEPSAQAVAALGGGDTSDVLQGGDSGAAASAAPTGGGTFTANGESVPEVAVPGLPDAPPAPTRPAERAKFKSARLAMANALISGNPDMPMALRVAMARQYIDAGLKDETEANKSQYETEAELDKTGYQGDISNRNALARERYAGQISDHAEAVKTNYKREEDLLSDQRKLVMEKEKAKLDQGTIKSPVFAQKQFFKSTNTISDADNALKLITGLPESVGLTRLLGDRANQRLHPQGTAARAAITNLAGLILNGISGSAVTPEEFARNRPWLPQVDDTPAAVRTKLLNIKRNEMQSIATVQGMYGNQGMFAYTPAATAPAPAAGGNADDDALVDKWLKK